MSIFFTSDTHFGHKNIIQFCNRPYKSVEEMDADIIARWNNRIGVHDTVYHLGDFTFYKNENQQRRIIDQLNGRINLILGNHDDELKHWGPKITIYDPITTLKIDHIVLQLCHYPMLEWDGAFRGAIHLHGHSHNLWPQTKYRRLDIGVDGNKMNPWSFEEIREWAKDRPSFNSEVFAPTSTR